MVIHGLSGTVSSADNGRSSSAGATLTRTHLLVRSLPSVTTPANSESDGSSADGRTGTALQTHHYELTMPRAALHRGGPHRRAVCEQGARQLPHGRRYGVVAGTGRLL